MINVTVCPILGEFFKIDSMCVLYGLRFWTTDMKTDLFSYKSF